MLKSAEMWNSTSQAVGLFLPTIKAELMKEFSALFDKHSF